MFDSRSEKVFGEEARERLHAVAQRVEPLVLAEERTLPVPEELAQLFPSGALRRGITLGIDGTGARSLALSLASSVTNAGSWAVFVGMAGLNLAVAAELGVALERVAVVDAPDPASWAEVIGALIGAIDLVVVAPEHNVRAGDVRRLTSRARERGSVLMQVGRKVSSWPEHHDLRLRIADASWSGLHRGHGYLQQRQLEIVTEGRRDAVRPRRLAVALPGASGRLVTVADAWAGADLAELSDGVGAAVGIDDGVVVPFRQVS